jgi:radical SAM protein with 4Fe4S-binding SPASM domain
MKEFGKGIQKAGWLDILIKPKTYIINRLQYRILNHFSNNLHKEGYSRFFAKTAKLLVGGYMHSIKLEINESCTMNCQMCYVKKQDNELSFKQITKLLDQIKNYKIRIEILGGEPLLRDDIVDIVHYAKNNTKTPYISLYTNGIHITDDIAIQLKNAGLDAIIVSLISHKPKTHDEFTGLTGSWEKCIDGIKICVKNKLNTYTFTAIHKENYHDFQNLYKFVKSDLKAHALFYQYIPQQQTDRLTMDPELWHKIKHWVLVKNNKEHAQFVRNFFMLTGNACSGGHFVLTVKADGTVQPCPFVTNIPLGNINNDSIWKIYRNRFKAPGFKTFKSIPDGCKSCSYKSVCCGGCKAGNDILYGEYSRKDHRCMGPYTENLNPDKMIDRIPSFF